MNKTTFLLLLCCTTAWGGCFIGNSTLGYILLLMSVSFFVYAAICNTQKISNLFYNILWKTGKHTPSEISKRYWENCQQFGLSYLYNEPDRFMNQVLFLDREIRPRINKQTVIADIACGDGWFSVLLSRFAGKVYGYDLSTHMIKTARERTVGIKNITFEQFDILQDKLTNTFDAICCMGLFTYIVNEHDTSVCIRNLYNNLLNGGAFILERLYKHRCEQNGQIP